MPTRKKCGKLSYAARICPKDNVIERLEFKLGYFDATHDHFSNYATGTFVLTDFIFIL